METGSWFDAIESGDADSVRDGLASGIDPNIVDATGFSALTVAARSNQPEITEILLRSGANPETSKAPR